ncbi:MULTISPECIES: M23 family metallopeptidase [unclassified Streptomyces]|uniref:M23 family metallopeptidase n=1 Tax=unclassified Streptomyces TaxID=2593676 RepID=UPI0033F608F7
MGVGRLAGVGRLVGVAGLVGVVGAAGVVPWGPAGSTRPIQPTQVLAAPVGMAGSRSEAAAEGVGPVWPVPGPPVVVRGWAPPTTPYGPGHRGVDLAAPPGTQLRAVTEGRVTFAGPVAGKGVLTITLNGSGSPPLRTTYEPVHPLVRPGDHVRAGQPVATVEAEPRHCGEVGCVHWGLKRGDDYLNPLVLVPRGHSRLLPVVGVEGG